MGRTKVPTYGLVETQNDLWETTTILRNNEKVSINKKD